MPKQSKEERHAYLDSLVDPEQAKEYVMFRWLINEAREFYANPENCEAYEKWKSERDAKEGN